MSEEENFELEVVDGKLTVVPLKVSAKETYEKEFKKTEFGYREFTKGGRNPNSKKTALLLDLESRGFSEEQIIDICQKKNNYKGIYLVVLKEYMLSRNKTTYTIADENNYSVGYIHTVAGNVRVGIVESIRLYLKGTK